MESYRELTVVRCGLISYIYISFSICAESNYQMPVKYIIVYIMGTRT